MQLTLIWLLAFALAAASDTSKFDERLTFHVLDNGSLLAHFQFTQSMLITKGRRRRLVNYGTFPAVMTELVEDYGVGEMRVSFGKGRWNQEGWGVPPVDLASTGFQLHAWLSNDNGGVDEKWEQLTGALSGIFCGSISLLSGPKTAEPKLSFSSPAIDPAKYSLRFGILPRETVCTENLTPWIKLLPCMSNGGLASLINPLKVYDSRFNLMDLYLRQVDIGSNDEVKVEVVQNLALVYDLERWTRSPDWSLTSLFDREVTALCPACIEPRVRLSYEPKLGDLVERHVDYEVLSKRDGVHLVEYKGDPIRGADIGVRYRGKDSPPGTLREADIAIERFVTGVGQESGSLFVRIRNVNENGEALPVKLLEVLPWYLRIYMHTLRAELNDAPFDDFKQLLFSPAIDRQKPGQIEYEFILPKKSTLTIEVDFDMSLLRYTEYPLDPNRGDDLKYQILFAYYSLLY